MSFVAGFRTSMRMCKKFWLPPIFIAQGGGGLVVLIQGSTVASFIYTIF